MNLSTTNQLEAFQKFQKLKVGALFMQMGTGKTKVAIDLVNFNQVDLLIYVAPVSTLSNIKVEIDKWGLNCDLILIGYETIASSDRKYLDLLNEIEKYKNKFIVADESIFIKNEKTKRFQRLKAIRETCKYALILNGTPLTKNEWDLFNQMEFLSPLIINMNRTDFIKTFFKKVVYKKSGSMHEKRFYQFSKVNAIALKKMIEPYVFNCDLQFEKQEIETFNYVDIDLNDYQNQKEKWLSMVQEKQFLFDLLALFVKLNYIQATNLKHIESVANHIENKQVVVYCSYIEEIDLISKKTRCLTITGSTPKKERELIINKFKFSNIPLLMTYGVGSFSLNLQFCNEIVYSSLSFDYAHYEQSKYRIKRIGQDRDIKYTYILSNCGITSIIEKSLSKKKNLIDLIKEELKDEKVLIASL